MVSESRIILILKILQEYTDATHDLSSKEIMSILSRHSIKVIDKRTIEADVDMLIVAGYDIEKTHRNGVPTRYRLVSRDFEPVELKILIDAVAASRFIRQDRSGKIIRALSSLAGPSDRENLLAEMKNLPRIKRAVGGPTITADTLYRAIIVQKKVRFQMISYRVPDKETVPHRDGHRYTVSPYAMIWSNDRYYLIAHDEERDIIITPRVDHIRNVRLTETPIHPAPEDFDIGYYYSSSYKMYDGPEEEITLRCKNSLLGKIMDRFGSDFECTPVSDSVFQTTVRASVGNTFYGWLLQYAGGIEIIGPNHVVEGFYQQMTKAQKGLI
ncbi:MAG: WYL domain-containing protein [Clostridia bacterium]|nr:WYL domain-containing protein [Clostridia bacterium]